MKNSKFNAIFDENLAQVLKKANQLEKIESGQIFCDSCSCLITLKNIQIIIPFSTTEFKYICNDPLCVEKYYKHSETEK
jgi:hypothetical protein